jgi:hexokinase
VRVGRVAYERSRLGSVGSFVKAHPEDGKLDLGFTFSFPVKQTALERGTLINWTKGFSATGAAGQDVAQLLQNALDEQQIPVQCSALVNDTVGTLLSYAYKSGDALVGAIFGTGTLALYMLCANSNRLPPRHEWRLRGADGEHAAG